ncbi:MAG: sigma-70 family RNA polymerase sigma factor [Isosphaeraceae bacterium]|nr:sigma-70 family RNA polymerase sigma factor [Isosphaeraceae bacterium]
MAWTPASGPKGELGVLWDAGAVAGLPDEQLLARFVSQRDAAAQFAFEALVRRYGPMVLGVCRGTLGDPHAADDAFQATFLVLARKAPSLREPALLGPWLYGVALRAARKARAQRARRHRLEQSAAVTPDLREAATPDRDLARHEEAEALHQEIGRLPDRYRSVLILCELEGLTHAEAACQLGWPVGTVGVRLMRARALLRDRLTRRRMAPTACATLLLHRPEVAATSLVAQTARAASSFALGIASSPGVVSAPIAAIAEGVIRTMATKKTVLAGAALVVSGLIATGAAALAVPAQRERPEPVKPRAVQKPQDARATRSVLSNGGFERGEPDAATPEGWNLGAPIPGVELAWDRTVAHEGRASLHLRKTAERYFPIAQWSQDVARTGTAPRLKLSAFAKAEKVTKAILDVQFLDKKGAWSHAWAAYIGAKDAGDSPVTHDWKPYQGVVEIPDGTAKLRVAVQIYGPGDIWFDDLVAEYTDAPATDPLSP